MYKKHKVVILPTEESITNILSENGSLVLFNSNPNFRKQLGDKFQNIYILSDEEIQEGDWYLVKHNIEGEILSDKLILSRAGKNFILNYYIKNNSIYSKVIASSDLSLLTYIQPTNTVKGNLPQLPQKFIQEYIEAWNKDEKIEEVIVEYEKSNKMLLIETGHAAFVLKNKIPLYILKISKNNTITIKETKDSWNREEVIKELEEYREFVWKNGATLHDLQKWINKNL